MLNRIVQCHAVLHHQKSYNYCGTSRDSSKTVHQHCSTLVQSLFDEFDARIEVRFQVRRGAIQNSHYLVGEVAGELWWDPGSNSQDVSHAILL